MSLLPLSRRLLLRHLAAGLLALAAPAVACSAETEHRSEWSYAASAGKTPAEIDALGYLQSTTGEAKLVAGSLQTTDTDPAEDGRFFALPAKEVELNEGADISLRFDVRVERSEGSRTATAIELSLPTGEPALGPLRLGGHGEGYQDVLAAGRKVSLGFTRDGKNHDRDELLLIDGNRPDEDGVLARQPGSLDQMQSLQLHIERRQPGADDDRVTLSRPSGEAIFSVPLSRFAKAPQAAHFALLFGHPARPGIASAQWRRMDLTVRQPSTTSPEQTAEKPPVDLNESRQLFLDDYLLVSRSNLVREQGRPVKSPANPVLRREKLWEEARCELYGSAIWNPGKERVELYYAAMRKPYDAKLAVAYSSDEGKTWKRPALSLFPYEGEPSNIVWPGRYWAIGPCVLLDPHDPDPQRRYKMFLTAAPVDPKNENDEIGPKGIDVVFSPDGVDWTPAPGNPVIPGFNSDTGNSVIWDERKQRYRAYVRMRCNVGRSVAITESKDFVHWSEPRTLYIPTPFDAARSWEFYGMSVTPVGDQYIGLVWIFPNTPDSSNKQSHSPVTWTELVVSRDGEKWERPFPGEPFLPLGEAGQFDHRQIRPASSFTLLPDGVLLLYSGSPHAHISSHQYDIGLARLRTDGFACLAAGNEPGELLTRPLLLHGKQLRLNANIARGGQVQAELLDADGKPIEGYQLADCDPLHGDQLNATVTWNGDAALPETRKKPVQLRLKLRDARLYSLHLQP
jgi:hypothetical protein